MTFSTLAMFLNPDGDEARRWAEDELSKAKYSEPAMGLIDRLGQWVIEQLAKINIEFGAGSTWTGSLTIILVVIILVIIAVLYGRLRPGGSVRRGGPGMILDDDRTEAVLLRDASRAHGAGDYASACVDYYRACIRILDSRGLIIASPGMTALEAAHQGYAATGLPLGQGARIFDSVMYGGGLATAADAQMMSGLVEHCRKSDRVGV